MAKKSMVVQARVTPEEKQMLQDYCCEFKMTESEVVRESLHGVLGKQSKESFLLEKSLMYEMNRIGNNINQIVKNHNAHFYSEKDKRELFYLMRELQKNVSVVRQRLREK